MYDQFNTGILEPGDSKSGDFIVLTDSNDFNYQKLHLSLPVSRRTKVLISHLLLSTFQLPNNTKRAYHNIVISAFFHAI